MDTLHYVLLGFVVMMLASAHIYEGMVLAVHRRRGAIAGRAAGASGIVAGVCKLHLKGTTKVKQWTGRYLKRHHDGAYRRLRTMVAPRA